MKTLYLDIFSGISGDMFLGALLDLGIDFRQLEQELAKLPLDGYHLHSARQKKSQIEGVKFSVHLAHGHAAEPSPEHTHTNATGHSPRHSHDEPAQEHHHHEECHDHEEHEHEHEHHERGRNFLEIKQLIAGSLLSDWVKEKSIAVFQRIAVAEGKIHGHPTEQVHFHEVGAVDSIVDIVGACVALEWLGRPKVFAGNVIDGTGWIDCAHGRFPIPAPATLSILGARGIPLSQCDEPHELVTPTGAALLAEFVEHFGPMQNLVATKIGFGLGARDHQRRPNVLRAILGESRSDAWSPKAVPSSMYDWETDTISVLETNLDDVTGEILGGFSEKALASGALDVFHTPIQMKKNRPGVLLTILCATSDADKFSEMILRETSAFGVRRATADRQKLRREFQKVKTSFGEVTVKIGKLNGKTIRISPEFESCKKLADEKNIPLMEIFEAVTKALG